MSSDCGSRVSCARTSPLTASTRAQPSRPSSLSRLESAWRPRAASSTGRAAVRSRRHRCRRRPAPSRRRRPAVELADLDREIARAEHRRDRRRIPAGLQLGLVPDVEHRVPDRRRAGHRLADDVDVEALRPDDRLDLGVDPVGVRRQLEQQVRAAPGRQAGRVLERAEQRVDRVRLHRADDDGGHLAALHQRDRDLGVLGAGRAHVGVEDAQRVFLAAHEHRPLDHRDRSERRLLAQVQLLDRPAAGIGERLDDRRCPHADRVEQGDHRGRGLEVGARRREVLADRLRRRAGDDQIADVAVDDLAALVDLGRDAFHDRGGREVLAAADDLGVLEVGRLGLRVASGPQVSEERCQHGGSWWRARPFRPVHGEQSRRRRIVRLVTATRGTSRPTAGRHRCGGARCA